MIALYPPFLAVALRTKLTRPFAGRGEQIISFTVAALPYASMQILYLLADCGEGVFSVLYFFMALLFLYAFVAQDHAWVVATGMARDRARIFILAFGFRDVCWNLTYMMAMWGIWVAGSWCCPDSVSLVCQ